MADMRISYKFLVGKSEVKSTRKTWRIRENNIRIDLREIAWGCVDWMYSGYDKNR
jgi:hypothetical protein